MARGPEGEEFHLAATQPIRIGYIICSRGEPLCGTPHRVRLPPPLLFRPDITCWICDLLARRDGIAVAQEWAEPAPATTTPPAARRAG